MRLVSLILHSIAVGALVSLMGYGNRNWHFLPSFIMFSGFSIGIGLIANKIVEEAFKLWGKSSGKASE